jgi:hypothetical protein
MTTTKATATKRTPAAKAAPAKAAPAPKATAKAPVEKKMFTAQGRSGQHPEGDKVNEILSHEVADRQHVDPWNQVT